MQRSPHELCKLDLTHQHDGTTGMSFPLSLSGHVSRAVGHENDDVRASFCHRVNIGSARRISRVREHGEADDCLRRGLIPSKKVSGFRPQIIIS